MQMQTVQAIQLRQKGARIRRPSKIGHPSGSRTYGDAGGRGIFEGEFLLTSAPYVSQLTKVEPTFLTIAAVALRPHRLECLVKTLRCPRTNRCVAKCGHQPPLSARTNCIPWAFAPVRETSDRRCASSCPSWLNPPPHHLRSPPPATFEPYNPTAPPL